MNLPKQVNIARFKKRQIKKEEKWKNILCWCNRRQPKPWRVEEKELKKNSAELNDVKVDTSK